VRSARLSVFPPLKLVAKGLSVAEHGERDSFIAIERAVVVLNAFKLLDREIYLSQVDIEGCRVLLSSDRDYGDGFLPLSFMSKKNGDDEDKAIKDPLTGWEITSINIHLQNGSIIYTEEKKANGPKKQSIENIYTKASIVKDNLVISSFGLSYQDTGITLSGSVKNFLKKDPVSNLQIQGEVPFATVKEFFPEQLASVENEVRCNMLFNIRGPISQLDIDSELNLLAAAETPQSLYIPADTLAACEDRTQLVGHIEQVKVTLVDGVKDVPVNNEPCHRASCSARSASSTG